MKRKNMLLMILMASVLMLFGLNSCTTTAPEEEKDDGYVTIFLLGADAQDGRMFYAGVPLNGEQTGGARSINLGNATIVCGPEGSYVPLKYEGGKKYTFGGFIDADSDAASTSYLPDSGDYTFEKSVEIDGNQLIVVNYSDMTLVP